MTRDISERLALFGAHVEVQRIALNWDQIEEYGPPPNPAKLSDSRAKSYIEEYGNESWELDALEPSVLESLIQDEVDSLTDIVLLNQARVKEGKDRKELSLVKDNWSRAVRYLNRVL